MPAPALVLGTQSRGGAAPTSKGVTSLRLAPGFLALAAPRQGQRAWRGRGLLCPALPITAAEVAIVVTSTRFPHLSCKPFSQESELFSKLEFVHAMLSFMPPRG